MEEISWIYSYFNLLFNCLCLKKQQNPVLKLKLLHEWITKIFCRKLQDYYVWSFKNYLMIDKPQYSCKSIKIFNRKLNLKLKKNAQIYFKNSKFSTYLVNRMVDLAEYNSINKKFNSKTTLYHHSRQKKGRISCHGERKNRRVWKD